MTQTPNPHPIFGALDSVEFVTIDPERNKQLRAVAGFTLRDLVEGITEVVDSVPLHALDEQEGEIQTPVDAPPLTASSIRVLISRAENTDGRIRRDLFMVMLAVIDAEWRERTSSEAEVLHRRAVMSLMSGQMFAARARIRRDEIEEGRNLFAKVAGNLREAEAFANRLREAGSPGFERAEHQVEKFVDLAQRVQAITEHFDNEIFDREIEQAERTVDQWWGIADDALAKLDAVSVEEKEATIMAGTVKGATAGK